MESSKGSTGLNIQDNLLTEPITITSAMFCTSFKGVDKWTLLCRGVAKSHCRKPCEIRDHVATIFEKYS